MPVRIIRIGPRQATAFQGEEEAIASRVKEEANSTPVQVERVVVHVLSDGRMRPKDAALYLGYSEQSLANWRLEGRGPRFIERARRIWYPQSWLDEWIVNGDRPLTLVPVKPRAKKTRTDPVDTASPASKKIADVCKFPSHRVGRGIVGDGTANHGQRGEP